MSKFAFVPRRMRLDAAAFYLGVSETTFLSRVREGAYPPGVREGGMRFWLLDELDEHLDDQFGRAPAKRKSGEREDPFVNRFGQGA